MKIKIFIFELMIVLCVLSACDDGDSFSTSKNNLLTFVSDTISLDTIFSNVPTSTASFWIHNVSGDGLVCSTIRLERGNQTGFRVNVDGSFLGVSSGYQVNNVNIRKNDSIRVFVELTSSTTNQDTPKLVEDNLVFTLQSGIQQKINLNAWSWDAVKLHNLTIVDDTTITSLKPIIVYGGIKVNENATLTIGAGTTLYFHADAGLDVYGKLLTKGTPENNVEMRGDRLDNMFDYLPYNYVSGQWKGITMHESSYDNELNYTDIHSAFNGITTDSSDVSRSKLVIASSTIHNCQGYGLKAVNSNINMTSSQITNTLHDCIFIDGGKAKINGCTLAQYYPFDSARGAALRFSNTYMPLVDMTCLNSLITGYADDVMMGDSGEDKDKFVYSFDHCVIRTPKVPTEDSLKFTNIIYEDIEDTTSMGVKNFIKIDTENLRYDFHLKVGSVAIGKADPATIPNMDRNGLRREDALNIGAFVGVEE